MSRAFMGSLAGATVGSLVGFVGVMIVSGGEVARDTGAMILILGSFLAGLAAIAGAVIGGVADLREISQKKDQASERKSPK